MLLLNEMKLKCFKFCSLNIVGFFAMSLIKVDLQLKRFSKIRLGPAFALLRPHYSNMSRFLGFLRVPLGSQFSNFSKVLLRSEFGVPHDSVLGPLLFNIDIINLFYECEDSNVASYVDDTTQNSRPQTYLVYHQKYRPLQLNFSVGLKITI